MLGFAQSLLSLHAVARLTFPAEVAARCSCKLTQAAFFCHSCLDRQFSTATVPDPNKIVVGGHSYGAFMTANLLTHAPHVFCCGIAHSGAYNQTLTPFGFQNEDRTLWEATSTYVEMSPFMSANKIKKPFLLIHGEEGSNSGTLTMQSDRFFNALKGHGALCHLVILAFESHGYAAQESIIRLSTLPRN